MNMYIFNAYSGPYGLQALLQVPICKHFFRLKSFRLRWNISLWALVLFEICRVGSWKALKKGKTVSIQCLPRPGWHFMRDIILGLSRICRLQSRVCGCMLGINPHLNPRGLLEIAQLLNEPFCLVANTRFPDTLPNMKKLVRLNKYF